MSRCLWQVKRSHHEQKWLVNGAKLTKGEAPDSTQMNTKVREMISEALQSDGIEEIFKLGEDGATEIDIFGDDYLAKI